MAAGANALKDGARSTGSVWREARKSLVLAGLIAGLLGACFYMCMLRLPKMTDDELEKLKVFPPRQTEQLLAQRDVLLNYADKNPYVVTLGLCTLYVLMQTFAIPGTLTLTVLSGALFGTWRALALVSVVSTLGSTTCYFMSLLCGKDLAYALWPDKLTVFEQQVQRRHRDLLNYIIFLRVTPILPNTFINVASPIVNVPLLHFICGTFLGCLPNNFVGVSAGSRLGDINSLADLYDRRLALIGVGVGVIALLPIILRKQQLEGPPLDPPPSPTTQQKAPCSPVLSANSKGVSSTRGSRTKNASQVELHCRSPSSRETEQTTSLGPDST